ncbi:MAG: hypothetical protein ABIH03_00355 [Pseudomonadota bacterium]
MSARNLVALMAVVRFPPAVTRARLRGSSMSNIQQRVALIALRFSSGIDMQVGLFPNGSGGS